MQKPGHQPRGRCPVCQGMYALRKTGAMRLHRSGDKTYKCFGSGQTPLAVEPPRSMPAPLARSGGL